KPFPGTIGAAISEAGNHSILPPRHNGGNMDTRHLVAGSKLYLAVIMKGALISTVDTHPAQRDGEVCGSAVEATEQVKEKVTLHRGKTIQEPRYELSGRLTHEADSIGYFVTTGNGTDLLSESKSAIRYMIEHLVKTCQMTEQEAYMLCSVAVDLRISEIVNQPNMVVSAFLPKAIFTK